VTAVLAALVIYVRIFSPHKVWEERFVGKPLVPAMLGLLVLATGVSALRRNTRLHVPPLAVLQALLIVWCAVCLAVNEGVSTGIGVFKGDFVESLVFFLPFMLIVDRLPRFKIVLLGVMLGLLTVGSLALTQVRGDLECAEWALRDMYNLKFDGRSCTTYADCYKNMPAKRLIPGIGPRNYRCERKGIFGIAAYLGGRVRWVGMFTDTSSLGAMLGMCICWLLGAAWGRSGKLYRLGWPAVALLALAIARATGSRAALLALAAGVGVALLFLWTNRASDAAVRRAVRWDRRIVIAGALAAVALVAVLHTRDETRADASTDSSNQARREAAMVGFTLWSQNPLFGVGYNRFVRYHTIGPHNMYLAAAGELGTPGLLLFVLTVWANFKALLGALRAARRAGHFELASMSAGMTGALLCGTVAFTVFLHGYDGLGWFMVIALVAGFTRAVQQQLPDYRFRLTHRDALATIPLAALVMGATYVALALSFSLAM